MDHLQNVMGYFDQQQPLCAEHDRISKDLYKEFGVKAGLRDENGKSGLRPGADVPHHEPEGGALPYGAVYAKGKAVLL